MKSKAQHVTGVAILDADVAYAGELAAALRARGESVWTLLSVDNAVEVHGIEAAAPDTLVIDPVIDAARCLRLISSLQMTKRLSIVAITSRPSATFVRELAAVGAELVLDKPLPLHEALHAIDLVRAPRVVNSAFASSWTLDRDRRCLVAPGGVATHVSDADQRLLECLAQARGGIVGRERLKEVVGRGHELDLNACVYRLRRRVALASGTQLPLRSKSGDGYVFSGAIVLAGHPTAVADHVLVESPL